MNGDVTCKQVVFEVDEELWKLAKIQSVKENIMLKEFVARAIKNELQRIESHQQTVTQ